jgi:DHA1 family multidrug resistance protein-like MFS transporter
MWDILRDSTFGHIVTFLFGNKVSKYPKDASHLDTSKNLNSKETNSEQTVRVDEQRSTENKDIESAVTSGGPSISLVDENLVIGWYDEDDQENPQNWSNAKRYLVAALLW